MTSVVECESFAFFRLVENVCGWLMTIWRSAAGNPWRLPPSKTSAFPESCHRSRPPSHGRWARCVTRCCTTRCPSSRPWGVAAWRSRSRCREMPWACRRPPASVPSAMRRSAHAAPRTDQSRPSLTPPKPRRVTTRRSFEKPWYLNLTYHVLYKYERPWYVNLTYCVLYKYKKPWCVAHSYSALYKYEKPWCVTPAIMVCDPSYHGVWPQLSWYVIPAIMYYTNTKSHGMWPPAIVYDANNEWLFVQWYRYFHEVKYDMLYSTTLRRIQVEMNISSFTEWKYLFYRMNKIHSLFVQYNIRSIFIMLN